MKHTPGPWEAISNGQIIAGNGMSCVHLIAKILRIDESIMTSRNWNDARLIAAAPELLEALMELVSVPNKHRPDRVYDEARAAIAKATGEGK